MRFIDNKTRDFDAICRQFHWNIPTHYNIGYEVCDKHVSRADDTALYYENADGMERRFTFGEIRTLSNRCANAIKGLGVGPGDRVAIVLPQRVETALAHLAVYKLGAVALPLSILFGPDAIEYRLKDSGAKVALAGGQHIEMLHELQSDLPQLETIVDCDVESDKYAFWSLLQRASESMDRVSTRADDPALLIYTSGTTGPPKGALVGHRSLPGNLTGFELSHNFFPQQRDLFWTPADWAWTGGLLDGLLPAWFYGKAIVAYEGGKFDGERAFHLIEKYRIRNAFIPPTALKMMRQVPNVHNRHDLQMRTIMSAGESVGEELIHWGREVLGVSINEMWGQTEFNYLVGNCSDIMEVKPGSIGKPYPGHYVEPIDKAGNVRADGQIGELAARSGDPVMFLGYWNNEKATQDKLIGDWFCTGDIGYRDGQGYLWFVGRKDDVISSAGYRIGPGEIEDSLLKHPAVVQAAVIGVPDELRGSIVKAFIVLSKEHRPSEALKQEIQNLVRQRLAAYEYPRQIEFIDELPMTTTGKVRRVELRQREISDSA
ncbi:MAG: AMP-binding protein [Gammaproteobacteria bacterium]|nr:AMP-binding protein [Gammaproteobacteria bacterium]